MLVTTTNVSTACPRANYKIDTFAKMVLHEVFFVLIPRGETWLVAVLVCFFLLSKLFYYCLCYFYFLVFQTLLILTWPLCQKTAKETSFFLPFQKSEVKFFVSFDTKKKKPKSSCPFFTKKSSLLNVDANAEKPGAPHGLNLTQEAGGWVLRWFGPKDDSKVLFYTIEYKTDSIDENWLPLTDTKIDKAEASYMSKDPDFPSL